MSDDNMSETPQQTNAAEKSIGLDKVVDERGVPLGNVLKEMNRKLGRVNELTSKIDMLLQNNVKPAATAPDNGPAAANIDYDTKAYIDARLNAEKRAMVEKAQQDALNKVFTTFPELDQNSDNYDSKFYNLAVEYEKTIDPLDPDRSFKAAKLAALDIGKIEALTKAKVLQDDSRRARILEEGSAPAKGTKKATPELKMNKSAIATYFKIDPAKVEKRAKQGDQ